MTRIKSCKKYNFLKLNFGFLSVTNYVKKMCFQITKIDWSNESGTLKELPCIMQRRKQN